MAVFTYFTQKVLESGFDLNQVFPEKQEMVRVSQGVSYGVSEIALFLKDRTENFKKIENIYVDLDSAISQIISKWYKIKGEKNPFVEDIGSEDLQFETKTPREAAVLDKGQIKGKGAPKAAPPVQKPAAPEAKPTKPTKTAEAAASKPATLQDRIENLKNDTDTAYDVFVDVFDEDEKVEFIDTMEAKLEGYNELLEEEPDEYLSEAVKILEPFIQKLKANKN